MDGNFNNGQYQIRETVREALRSTPFLIMAITFSASLIISVINMVYYISQ